MIESKTVAGTRAALVSANESRSSRLRAAQAISTEFRSDSARKLWLDRRVEAVYGA